MNSLSPITLSKPEHLLPPGVYEVNEVSQIQSLVNKFRGWLQNSNTKLSELDPHTDVYKRLLQLAGGENSNRWTLEQAYGQIIRAGEPDEPTDNNEDKLLPAALRGDSKPEQTPTQITHKQAQARIKAEILEREQEEAREMDTIINETQNLNARWSEQNKV